MIVLCARLSVYSDLLSVHKKLVLSVFWEYFESVLRVFWEHIALFWVYICFFWVYSKCILSVFWFDLEVLCIYGSLRYVWSSFECLQGSFECTKALLSVNKALLSVCKALLSVRRLFWVLIRLFWVFARLFWVFARLFWVFIRVGLSRNGLPVSSFQDKWQIWDGKRKTYFSPSRIVTFLPVQIFLVPAGPQCDVFREGCDKKRHKLKKKFRVRDRHILPRNVTNVTFHIFCHRKKWQMWRHSPKCETGSLLSHM